MSFPLTQDQALIQQTVREFATREIAPKAEAIDRSHAFPMDSIPKMADLGLFGMNFPQQEGGAGTDAVSYAIGMEEVSRACASHGVIMTVNNSLSGWPLHTYGNDEQKQKYLRPMLQGQRLGAFGLTEPNAGSDVVHMQSRAVRDGDDWVLNGQKVFITNGGIAETYVVFAQTNPEAGHKGQTAFLLEKGQDGFEIGKPEDKLGICAAPSVSLYFKDVRVSDADRLGEVGQGFQIAMKTLDGGRIGVASQALGIAQASLDHAVSYAKERKQFGVPIGNHQAVQFMISDMAVRVEAARQLTYHAARCKDQGVPYSREAAMAKLYASEAAMWCATKAVQVHGGNGYIKDYPVERLMRDAKITEIYEGTSEIQRMVIARDLVKRGR